MHSAIMKKPEVVRVITILLSLSTIAILASCFTRRIQRVNKWSKLSFHSGLILAIYVDSFIFAYGTSILLNVYGLNSSASVCSSAVTLFVSYASTKILIYYFLVEKCYIIRNVGEPRRQNKLWLFNVFGVMIPYFGLISFVTFSRFSFIDDQGVCIIGMHRKALIPTVVFDFVLNIWLTTLFLQPLRESYSYNQNKSHLIRTVVVRTFVGSCVTLTLSIANLSMIIIMDGEPGYLCLCLCNLDILCTTLVLHWVTAIDRPDKNTINSRGIQNLGAPESSSSNIIRSKIESWEEFNKRVPDTVLVVGTAACKDVAMSPQLEDVMAHKTRCVHEMEIQPCDSRGSSDSEGNKDIFRSNV